MCIDASKKIEYHELEEVILTSVNKLPKRCKYIFELSRFEHKSNKEISICITSAKSELIITLI